MASVTSGPELVGALLHDHEAVKGIFARFHGQSSGRSELFCELTTELVRHEIAEEEVVYPEVRTALPGGEKLADARIAEQSEAEEMLASMEKMDPESGEFSSKLSALERDVLAHAQHEEQEVFIPLRRALTPERLDVLGGRYETAKASAPTHPHPHAPDTPPGNLVLGPVAALADRMRDAIRRI